MAKKEIEKETKPKTIKILVPIIDGMAFGLKIVEIDESLIEKNGKVIDKTEPDLFNIFVPRLERIFRDIFGI